MPDHNATHEEFKDALAVVRRDIIREQWEIAEGTIAEHEDRILGYCHENVIGTCEELVSRGYEPRFVWGR